MTTPPVPDLRASQLYRNRYTIVLPGKPQQVISSEEGTRHLMLSMGHLLCSSLATQIAVGYDRRTTFSPQYHHVDGQVHVEVKEIGRTPVDRMHVAELAARLWEDLEVAA